MQGVRDENVDVVVACEPCSFRVGSANERGFSDLLEEGIDFCSESCGFFRCWFNCAEHVFHDPFLDGLL